MFTSSSLRLFRLFGVDVYVSLFYGFLILLCVYYYGVAMGLIAALAITLSIIIHEYGHAFVCKRYDLTPFIVLHGLGGVCVHRPASTDGRAAWIAAAGPLLQIGAGIVVFLAMIFGVASLETVLQSITSTESVNAVQASRTLLIKFLSIFSGFSIFWGVINLIMPIWPLDGSKLFLVLLRRFMPEDRARVWTLRVGLGLSVPIGIWALMSKSLLLAVILFQMAFDMWRLLRTNTPLMANSSGKTKKPKLSEGAQEMLDGAKEQFKQENWREAARLCHLLRATGGAIPNKTMGQVWEILGVATTEMGEYEEALGWLKRAPDTKAVEQARARCLEALGKSE